MTKLPLSLVSVSSYLVEAGIEVEIIDQRIVRNWRRSVTEALARTPICVGISSMTGVQIKFGLDAARLVKRISPNLPVVWGGAHPTVLPEQTLENSAVDIVVHGEGERSFSDLVMALSRGEDLSGVRGISYRTNGRTVTTEPQELLDMNQFPPLPYHLVDMEAYFTTHIGGQRSLMLIPDRGCSYRCTFCSCPSFHRFMVRTTQAPRVFEEIVRMVDLGAELVDLGSENFFESRARVEELCEQLFARGVEVGLKAQCRVNYVDKWPPEFLKKLRRAGFVGFQLGAESGSNRVLRKVLKKGISVEQIKRVNLKLKDAGIAPYYSFFIGSPGETLEEVEETIDLAIQLCRDNPQARTTNLQLFLPIPGTKLFDQAVARGFVPPDNLAGWSDFYSITYPWLSKRQNEIYRIIEVVTNFIEGKVVGEALNSRMIGLLSRLYSRTVVFRLAKRKYSWFPEAGLLRLLKSML
ncbi:MAG: B12-binding domain-containing radical SAM protein [Proteobacteria bacterium]|nr:B12-binding domain-containing radical SAM protein [Pseudomonadota bacterium]